MTDDAAFPASPYAFDAPGQSPFDSVDQSAQSAAQIQAGFDDSRSRRNYIQAIAKGAATRPGAVRASVAGGS